MEGCGYRKAYPGAGRIGPQARGAAIDPAAATRPLEKTRNDFLVGRGQRKRCRYLLQRGTSADPIIALDRQGHVLRSWGRGLFKIPHGIRLDREGNVWTVDSGSSLVQKFSSGGKKLLEIPIGGQPPSGKFNGATDIAFGPDGRVYVADGYGNARILEYAPDGRLLGQWGAHGAGPGQFNVPHAIVIGPDSVVYVADRENGRVQRFDLEGRYLGEWDGLGKPMTLRLQADGSLLVGTGYRNQPGRSPAWLAWILKIDTRTGKLVGYLEVGDDAHALETLAEDDILTGGEAGWSFGGPPVQTRSLKRQAACVRPGSACARPRTQT